MSEPSWEPDPADDATLAENWLFTLRRERFRSRKSGRTHDFYVLHLADAVSVVATTLEGKLILVRQFRAGAGRDSLETPGGLVDAGEDPVAAGLRELLEETGYAGENARLIGSACSNPSLMTSRIFIVQVDACRPVSPPSLDEGEEVAIELVEADEALTMVGDGRIDHALAALSLLTWARDRAR